MNKDKILSMFFVAHMLLIVSCADNVDRDVPATNIKDIASAMQPYVDEKNEQVESGTGEMTMADYMMAQIIEANKQEIDAYGKNNTSWEKPALVNWSDNEILLGGIGVKEISTFYVWSITGEKMLWYLSRKQRIGQMNEYSKESYNKKITFRYGVPPDEWEQWYPYTNKFPVLPNEGEKINVVFEYSYSYMGTMRGDFHQVFLERSGNAFKKIELPDTLIDNLYQKINIFCDEMRKVRLNRMLNS